MHSWHIAAFEDTVERGLREITQRHFPLDWKEDLIVHQLAIHFRSNFRQVTLYGTLQPLAWISTEHHSPKIWAGRRHEHRLC